MIFIAMHNVVKENSFGGAPGGWAGTSNYGGSYGTFASPDVSQNPNKFASSNRNKAVNQFAGTGTFETGSLTTVDGNKEVDTLFTKKDKPTVDDVITGLKYEMGKMITPNREVAKRLVIQNLKKSPKYYTNLDMLNINDSNPITGSATPVNIQETKRVLDDMIAQRADDWKVENQAVSDIMQEMLAKKKERRSWY